MRRRQAGDVVTYVVNRNINFTNVCIKHCTFCAFSRDHREEEGYFLPMDEVVRRAVEAWEMGATEVCIQAGLPPKLDGWLLRRPLPRHQGGAARDAPARLLAGGDPVRLDALGLLDPGLPRRRCKEAGLGTLPGTSAEILDQEIRDRHRPRPHHGGRSGSR